MTARVLALPLAVGLSFELLRWAAAQPGKPLARALVAPGLQLQRLTTREPDRAQLEVALAALEAVLAAEAPARAPARAIKAGGLMIEALVEQIEARFADAQARCPTPR